jgi:hypothetical protein
MARKLLTLLLILFASPASAQIYRGTASGDDVLGISIPSGPGNYQLSFQFSKPVPLSSITIWINAHHRMYYYFDDDYIDTWDTDDSVYAPYSGVVRSGSFFWTIRAPYSINYGGIFREDISSQGLWAEFDFVGSHDTTFDYVIGLPTIPAAVPEPAAWALLITGFGLGGAALRRRRRTVPRTLLAA